MISDLHIHSTYSDGTNTPAELIKLAKERGVKCISLTDHDTVQGVEEAVNASRALQIDLVPGIELTTAKDGYRIHILGYFIDICDKAFLAALSDFNTLRCENTRKVLEKLGQLGILNYSWERVLFHSKGKSWLSSTDVLNAMIMDGCVPATVRFMEFYTRYFSKNSPAYIELGGISALEAIDIILKAKGIPVLAHPKLINDDNQIPALVKNGLMGIEVHYPANDEEDILRYTNLAEKYGLLITGGTDWHGANTQWEVELGDFGIDRNFYDIKREKLTKKAGF